MTAPFSHDLAPALPAGTRITHVVRQFHPNRGGLEDVVANLCRVQRELGLSPSVVTLDRLFVRLDQVLPTQEVLDGIPVTRIPFRGSTRYPLAPSVFRHLGDADLVHVHAIDFFFDALAFGWPLHRKPLVATTHGGFFHTGDFSALKTLWFNGPTRLSALAYRGIAGCSANDARLFGQIAPGRVTVIENGVDLDKFAGASSPEPRKRLVSIGRFSKNKRPDRLIATMAALARREPGWHLDLIGVTSDWSEEALRAAIAAAGVEQAVTLHLGLGDAAVRALMSQASLFVSASEFEGFGLALIEAMSAGLVPIVQPNAAFAALADKFPTVHTVDFADPERAATAVREAHSALLRAPAATRPRLSDLASYSWNEVARRYLDLYAAALYPASRRR
ncbi:glycosyltransferase family 4 protein [uncultured Bosea sp.]|uniref:glycosyltransferase family 4 protein n=1 Tax=uncultured Bosea sp. TaxID=211457 RepID=UPI0026000EB9|nr:glycosyltransferase family 4 protein [uncultured Bosea sp.]